MEDLLQCPHLLRQQGVFVSSGQGSYSSLSKHLAIRFMGLHDWIINEKLVIDHVSTKGQLSDITTIGVLCETA